MFEYDQPMGRQKVDSANARSPDRAIRSSVLHLVQLLIRRAVWIVGAALVCACIAVVIGKSMTPRYSASTQLYVDPRELQLVERELAPRSQDLTGLAMVVESQVRVITSNNVLLKVIGDLDLEKDPEFGGKSPMGFLSGLFSFGSDSAAKKSDERAGALEALRRHINVKRTDRTFIVDIEAWSNEAAKAATLANAIASAYLEESRESQSAAARRATTDLSARLKELQERLRLNENNLATYKARNNFVGSQDTQVSDQQLLSSTQRLANAQAATLDARAKYNQIEASRKNATDPGAIPEALQSPTIASLRTQFSDTRRRQAELQSELGPLHPAVRMVDKQVEDVRRNISEEIARFAQSAKNDLTRAQDLEASLLKSLDGQKRQSADLTQASVKLRELEREAEASRAIYQSFLKRSRETEEQESLNTSSARITGEATVPQRRVFPPAMSLLAMIGFVLGGLAAIGAIIAWDTLAPRKEDALAPAPVRATDVAVETPKQVLTPAQATLLQRPAPPPGQASSPPQVFPPPPTAPTPPMTSSPPISSPLQTSDRLYFRLQETDVLRTLNGIFPLSGSPDIVRLGWPTINPGPAATRFTATALRLADLAKARTKPGHATTIATIGIACDDERTIVALNLALAIKQAGARVLLIDADRFVHGLSSRLNSRATTSQLIGSMMATVQPAPETMSGVAIQGIDFARGGNALIKAVDEARMSGLYDLIVLDGPAIPAIEPDRRLFESIDGALAVLPAHLPASDHLDKTIVALPGGEDKVLAVMFSELAVKPREGASAPHYA